MPRFRILIEGSGIAVSGGVAGVAEQVVRGFFVARNVQACSPQEAIARARALVADDWSQGLYSHLEAVPTLAVAEVKVIGFWKWLRPEHTSYAFHSNNPAL